MQKSSKFNTFYIAIAIFGVLVLHNQWVNYQAVSPLAYSEFQKLVSEGKVKEVVITDGELRGELKNPEAPNKRYFRTTRVDGALASELQKHDVKFSGQVDSKLLPALLSWILPLRIIALCL